ncbi:MAG: PilZ domain-containing protein [Desulfobacterales bacterium]|nr:PilZ domain-containing protein [Desulfobacterales bacterium]
MSNLVETRCEPRTKEDQYYSVEFEVPSATFAYQFRIWNLSSKGICVVVKDDSDLLKHLKVGDVLNMKYYPTDSPSQIHLRTEIKHITKEEQGRFKGHTLVGLLILEKQTSDQ